MVQVPDRIPDIDLARIELYINPGDLIGWSVHKGSKSTDVTQRNVLLVFIFPEQAIIEAVAVNIPAKSDIESFQKPGEPGETVDLSERLSQLGDITYHGKFAGF
ncbi:unnamed protein product, partial [marine sediment metagenome]